eukprot:GFKZ01003314.1.p1 GENE.GFKZ01003314.1~~GFKZ01003314.1.p1  ORF type:complete len:332 (-),score=52.42 GFKZ01003314.1:472-1407(-)
MKADWTAADIPDLSSKVAVVTGSNIGLGLEIATRLAQHNAHVILACRTVSKAETAQAAIVSQYPNATVTVMQVDMSSFESVRSFVDKFKSEFDRLDILMCNAGVMAFQERRTTESGLELQLATNHLGHFLLVGLLMDVLKRTDGSRVVTQSSSANWFGSFNFDDLNAEKDYKRWNQYSMTKLANVVFVNELNRRVAESGAAGPKAWSVHPGLVIGQLQEVSAGGNVMDKVMYKVFGYLAGTYETGARPALVACAGEGVEVGQFFGPNGIMSGMFKGNHPKAVTPNKLAGDKEVMRKLWEVSEEMTGFKYEF